MPPVRDGVRGIEGCMFGFLKNISPKRAQDPAAKLNERYLALLKEARDLQRAGKIPEFGRKTAEAEAVLAEIDALRRGETVSLLGPDALDTAYLTVGNTAAETVTERGCLMERPGQKGL